MIPAENWSIEQVCEWASENNLSNLVPIIEEHEINGEQLLNDMNKEALVDLGFKIIKINSILRKIESLRSTVSSINFGVTF